MDAWSTAIRAVERLHQTRRLTARSSLRACDSPDHHAKRVRTRLTLCHTCSSYGRCSRVSTSGVSDHLRYKQRYREPVRCYFVSKKALNASA
jgi:hypothetical protein